MKRRGSSSQAMPNASPNAPVSRHSLMLSVLPTCRRSPARRVNLARTRFLQRGFGHKLHGDPNALHSGRGTHERERVPSHVAWRRPCIEDFAPEKPVQDALN